MTINEITNDVVNEMKEILKKNNVPEEETKETLVRIQWLGLQWYITSITARALEEYMKKNKLVITQKDYRKIASKLEKKYPFDIEELESEEK